MSVTVTPARAEDMAAIGRVLERAYAITLAPDYPGEILRRVLPIISVPKPELVASGRYFVARQNGAIMGVGGWSLAGPRPETDQEEAHIRHVAVDPASARLGIGSAVMRTVFDQARASGVPRLMCLSTLTAVPFYASHGFIRQKPVSVMLGQREPFDCVLMAKPLNPEG